MLIRPATEADHEAIWRIISPAIAAGETYALPRDMSRGEALAYWTAPDQQVFVAEQDSQILGTYFLRANKAGDGAHVANCGYITSGDAAGRGVGRRMGEHSIEQARARGFLAMQFDFVISTNEGAIRLWQLLGFEAVGRLPLAFRHPRFGYVDALVMFRAL